MLTRNRIGNALATVAAVVGLVLMFGTHQSKAGGDDDAKPGTTPPAGQVQQAPAPAAPGVGQPGQPAQPGQPPTVQPAQPAAPAPAPAPKKKDNDGDNDGD